jgi:hypothetical protein
MSPRDAGMPVARVRASPDRGAGAPDRLRAAAIVAATIETISPCGGKRIETWGSYCCPPAHGVFY